MKLGTYIRDLRAQWRELGWREFVRQRGWRVVVGVIAFYLVRDLVLYVFIPLALYWGLF